MSKIHFPITSVIVEHGRAMERELTKKDVVKCYFCEKDFPAYGNVIVSGSYDCNKSLRCPECGRVASVVYYYDRIVVPKSNRKRGVR